MISIKSSDVMMCARAHELIAEKTKYPLHVGITEAGTLYSGNIKSAVGLGIILSQGIGDTIRVSLTGAPLEEIKSAKRILKTLGLRKGGIEVVSCPTCGRTRIDLIGLANQVETMVQDIPLDIKVAVMGCVVNGPGEAKEADIGIAGGVGVGLLIKKGEIIKKVPEDQLLDTLREELLHWKNKKEEKMEKDFFDVFPNLKIKDPLQELLDMVAVTRVSCNPDKTRLWVYISSERWIHKKYIIELQQQIERQCFPGIQMQVTVIEKFRLSRQYTPDNFLEVYRSSMELELRNYNMLEYNLFKRSRITFSGTEEMNLVLPDSVIAREKVKSLWNIFIRYSVNAAE